MSTVELGLDGCTCLEPPTDGLMFCSPHHKYAKGGKILPSVTQIIEAVWPVQTTAPEWRRENARERGVEVDGLFSAWLSGSLREIPVDTREDSLDLFTKLTAWWDKNGFADTRAQVRMSSDEIAGTADIVPPKRIWDLKTVYALEAWFSIQLGGYCHLYEYEHGELPEECGIVHLTERYPEPRFHAFEPVVVVSEFRVMLDFYRLVNRKAKRGKQSLIEVQK